MPALLAAHRDPADSPFDRSAGKKPPECRRALPSAPLGRHRPRLLGLLSLFLGIWLSCNPPPRTQNPSTLWVGFGQTELDLVLTDSEPPYY